MRRAAFLAAVAACLLTATPVAADELPLPTDGCIPPPPRVEPSVPWAQQMLVPQRVWPLTKGAGVTVGVIDSGVAANTPQLAGALRPGVNVQNAAEPATVDCYGHGTFVAGIIAARPVAGAGFAGMAPEATILPIRDASSRDDGSAAAMAAGIRAAVDRGATVLNVSASTTFPDTGLRAAVDYAEAHDVLVVAAAANGAQDGNPTTYPAAFPGVLAVGAIDAQGNRADFSQTGTFVGLVAPGVDVISVGPGGPGHWQGSGTSYATPFVAGTAALVRAYHPDLSAAQVQHRLLRTAEHPGMRLPDPALGWGTVNPYGAVTAVLPEESGTVARPAAAAPARPVVPVVNPLPGRLLVIAVVGGLVLVVLAVLVTRLTRRRPLAPDHAHPRAAAHQPRQ